MLDRVGKAALDRIPARLVQALTRARVGQNSARRELAHGYARRDGGGKRHISLAMPKRETRRHLVGAPRERTNHRCRLLNRAGLAKHLSVEDDHSIGHEHRRHIHVVGLNQRAREAKLVCNDSLDVSAPGLTYANVFVRVDPLGANGDLRAPQQLKAPR